MEGLPSQQKFFSHIKSRLPSHISLVDEIAERLDISNDSAYRRIRGEKPMALDEMQILCNHYKVSLDQVLQLNTDTVMFSGNLVDSTNFNLNKYLGEVFKNLCAFKSMPGCQMYNFNKDVPIFHYMQFTELCAFKFFFWKRTLMNYPELAKQKFDGTEHDEDAQETGRNIISTYSQIPSIEIWNDESVNATIRQIEYYRQSGVFLNKDLIHLVYQQLEELINHLEIEAESGRKFIYNEKPTENSATYQIYINECLLGDNTVHVKAGDRQVTIINHGGMNFMATQDKRFCEYTFANLQNIIRKSTHVSVVGEKERSMFFNSMKAKIREKMKNIH